MSTKISSGGNVFAALVPKYDWNYLWENKICIFRCIWISDYKDNNILNDNVYGKFHYCRHILYLINLSSIEKKKQKTISLL